MCWRDPAAGRSSTTRSCEYPGGGGVAVAGVGGPGAPGGRAPLSSRVRPPRAIPRPPHTHTFRNMHAETITRTHIHTLASTRGALYFFTRVYAIPPPACHLFGRHLSSPCTLFGEAAPQRTQRPGLRLVLWERLGSERREYLVPRCLGRPGAGTRRGQPGVRWKGGEGGGLTVRSDQVELGATPGGGAGVAGQGELTPGRAARLQERRKHASPPPRSSGQERNLCLRLSSFLPQKVDAVCVWKEVPGLGDSAQVEASGSSSPRRNRLENLSPGL